MFFLVPAHPGHPVKWVAVLYNGVFTNHYHILFLARMLNTR